MIQLLAQRHVAEHEIDMLTWCRRNLANLKPLKVTSQKSKSSLITSHLDSWWRKEMKKRKRKQVIGISSANWVAKVINLLAHFIKCKFWDAKTFFFFDAIFLLVSRRSFESFWWKILKHSPTAECWQTEEASELSPHANWNSWIQGTFLFELASIPSSPSLGKKRNLYDEKSISFFLWVIRVGWNEDG